MNADDNKRTLRRFDQHVEACEPERLDEICTPDMENHALASHRTPGLQGTKEFLRECRGDPDKAAWMHRMMGQHDLVTVAEGDYVIQFGRITATWPGNRFRGYDIPSGDYECDVAFMYRFRDGLITDRWAIRDDLAMIQQLCGSPAGDDK